MIWLLYIRKYQEIFGTKTDIDDYEKWEKLSIFVSCQQINLKFVKSWFPVALTDFRKQNEKNLGGVY